MLVAPQHTAKNNYYKCAGYLLDSFKMKAITATIRIKLAGKETYYFAYFMYTLSKKYDLYFLVRGKCNQTLHSKG